MSTNQQLTINQVRAAVLGLAVGDALGVPVEFLTRTHLNTNPVIDMRGHGTHDQPAGTWSDDTSLTLCLMHSLSNGLNWQDQAAKFRQWKMDDLWTPHGQVFDIGTTTSRAIANYRAVDDPRLAGPNDQYSNGNGSLMRILPMGLYFAHADSKTRIELAMQASCLTHRHIRSQLACGFYVELVAHLVQGESITDALVDVQQVFAQIIEEQYFQERMTFTRVLDDQLGACHRDEIPSSGYVMDTLAASLWCCLNAQSYEQAVLTAVNLGNDTDTTAAVAGGLAGLVYGIDAIPKTWLTKLAKRDQIEKLCLQFHHACINQPA